LLCILEIKAFGGRHASRVCISCWIRRFRSDRNQYGDWLGSKCSLSEAGQPFKDCWSASDPGGPVELNLSLQHIVLSCIRPPKGPKHVRQIHRPHGHINVAGVKLIKVKISGGLWFAQRQYMVKNLGTPRGQRVVNQHPSEDAAGHIHVVPPLRELDGLRVTKHSECHHQ